MITPKEIETKVFSRAKTGGYRPEEVDSFLDEILLSYTKLLNEREQLNKKVASLTNKLEAAKEEQDQWKNTILNTQKSYNDVMQTAKKKADKLVYEAQDYAKKLIQSAQEEAENQKNIKETLANEVEDFKTKLLSIYQSHVKLISGIPVIKKEIAETDSKTLEVLKAATADVEDRVEAIEEPVIEEPAPVVEEAPVIEPVVEEVVPVKEEPAEDLSVTRVIEGTRAQRFADFAREEEEPAKPATRATRAFANLVEEEDDDDDDDKVSGLFDNKKSKLFGGKKKSLGIFGKKKASDDDDDYDDDDYDDDDYDDDDDE